MIAIGVGKLLGLFSFGGSGGIRGQRAAFELRDYRLMLAFDLLAHLLRFVVTRPLSIARA